MKKQDIRNIYTQKVTELLNQGYTLFPDTMGGSQGEWMPFRPGSEACGSVFCRQWPENIVPDGELVGAKFGRLPEKSLSLPIRGEVLEWLKRRAWKARIRLKRIRGSNPLLSANDREVGWVANDIRLQPFCFSEATNLFGTFRDRP